VVILVSGVLVLELWLPREEDIGDAPMAVARDMAEDLLLFPQLGFWQSFLVVWPRFESDSPYQII